MNTFGGISDGNQFPLYDPRSVRADRLRFGRDRIPALDRANSLYVPAGRWPTRGWLLMARADYDQLDKYSTTLRLSIGDTNKSGNVGTMGGLAIVQARCVTRGLASDKDALYLVEVTDGRGVICNRWFQYPVATQYNIRAPAYPGVFHPSSMDGSNTWTWATMLSNLWSMVASQLGPWPGFPAGVTISGTPEGFWFPGVPVWPAICDILDHLGLTVACDLTKTTKFTVVSSGSADTTFDTLVSRYATNLEDDLEWIDTGAGRVPKTVQVLFRRRNEVYGTEETVTYRSDTQHQWDMNAYYVVTVAAPARFTSAVGSHYIWSDFTVRYDMDNNPVAADVATATAIAQERVTQYFLHIYSATVGYLSQRYAGALPFATGSQVDGVCWQMDHRRDGAGWTTHVVRGASPPFADVWDE